MTSHECIYGRAQLLRSRNNSLILPLYAESAGNEELQYKPLTRNDAEVDEFRTLRQMLSAMTQMSSDLQIYISTHRGQLNNFPRE